MKAVAQRVGYLLFAHTCANLLACVALVVVLLPIVGGFTVFVDIGEPLWPSGSRAGLAFPLVPLTKGCTRLLAWPQDLSLQGVVALAWVIYLTTLVLAYRWVRHQAERDRRAKQARLRATGLCPTCQYNLTGNTSGTCPECGTAIPSRVEA